MQQLFIAAQHAGIGSADGQARYAWNALQSVKQRLVVDGKTLQSEAENLAELERMATATHDGPWGLWQRLGLVNAR
jgi:hypothetical protein